MQSTTPALPARVWDRFVRFFHWSLVSCVLANYFLVDDGETLHQFIGYLAAGLVAAASSGASSAANTRASTASFRRRQGCAPTSPRCGAASIRFIPVTTRSGR